VVRRLTKTTCRNCRRFVSDRTRVFHADERWPVTKALLELKFTADGTATGLFFGLNARADRSGAKGAI